PFERILEPINSVLNFHDNRVRRHRSKHGTNSSRKSLHRTRVVSYPADNVADSLANTFAEILSRRGNFLHPVIKASEEILQVRLHVLNKFLAKLPHRSPGKTHRTSECFSSLLR